MITRSPLIVSAAVLAALATAILAFPVDARVGGGSSSGSRGARTFSAPAPTNTVPQGAQPMQRTETPSMGAQRPGYATPPVAGPRFGFGTGLMAGLFGAGLFGMLSGHGFFGGLMGLTSILGFLFQLALIVGIAWFGLKLLRGRSQPAFAGVDAPSARSAMGGGLGGGAGTGGSGGVGGTGPGGRDIVGIGPSDYAAFERSLVEIQAAYGREDLGQLSRLATPEMVRVFAADIEDNRRRGARNEVSGAKLLQGDLSESWREGAIDYATVAMRFSVVDTTVDRQSGRVLAGDPARAEEVREIWTFQRDRGAPWILSAIQQVA